MNEHIATATSSDRQDQHHVLVPASTIRSSVSRSTDFVGDFLDLMMTLRETEPVAIRARHAIFTCSPATSGRAGNPRAAGGRSVDA